MHFLFCVFLYLPEIEKKGVAVTIMGIIERFSNIQGDGKPENQPHPIQVPRYSLAIGLEGIKEVFTDCDDFSTREITLGESGITVSIAYIDGIVSGRTISEDIIRPMTSSMRIGEALTEEQAIQRLQLGAVYSSTVHVRDKMDDLASDITSGFCAVIFDGAGKAVTFEVKSSDRRSVGEPSGEKVLKGAKDAFVESLRINTSLVRQRIKNPDLKVKQSIVGRQSQTSVAVIYIEGLTNRDLVGQVEKRLSEIDIDDTLTTGALEGFLSDNEASPLPQLIYTERVDKFCLNITEGRVGIIVDGLPLCYVAPGTFSQFLKAPEDTSEHFIISSALTLLRYLCLLVTLFLPAFYVAITMYHQEMIPTQLMMAIIESKQNVPFSTPVEVIAMLIAFELLQEAAVRLPNPVGDAVGLIGALIVGQSAVEARVLSPLVVIVVGIAGIAGYTVTNLDLASSVRLGRFALVVMALLFGMYGIAVTAVIFVYHMASLSSLGVPYLSPFADADYKSISQAVLAWPPHRMKFREGALKTENRRKQR